jgi:hypothetical protein
MKFLLYLIPAGEAKALQALCYFQIVGLEAREGLEEARALAPGHPVTALAESLIGEAEAAEEADERKKRRLGAKAFGKALMYALHPMAGGLGPGFGEMAIGVLKAQAPSLAATGVVEGPSSPTGAGQEEVRERGRVMMMMMIMIMMIMIMMPPELMCYEHGGGGDDVDLQSEAADAENVLRAGGGEEPLARAEGADADDRADRGETPGRTIAVRN